MAHRIVELEKRVEEFIDRTSAVERDGGDVDVGQIGTRRDVPWSVGTIPDCRPTSPERLSRFGRAAGFTDAELNSTKCCLHFLRAEKDGRAHSGREALPYAENERMDHEGSGVLTKNPLSRHAGIFELRF